MKRLILFLSWLVATQYSFAQITLSASGYTSTVAGTTDTMKMVTPSSLPAITTGANQTWDFSNVTYDSTFYQQHSTIPTGTFSTIAQYTTDSVQDSTGYTYYYYQNNMNGIATTGLLDYGEHFDQQVEPIQSYPILLDDTLTLLSQDVVFSNPIRNIAFPATYADHWSDTVLATIHGTMTVIGFQYFDSAFEFRYRYQTYDTVKGWGILKVENNAGGVTNIPVLQVKSVTYRTDTTIVGGSEITESQHDFTGLPVGFGYDVYEYKYYAMGEVTPVAEVFYDYSFTTPQRAVMLSKNFPPATGVAAITAPGNVTIYPNPVKNHIFYISVPEGSGGGSYDVINNAGQLVCSGKFAPNQSSCSVQLGKEIAPGIYYVRITNNGQVSVQKLAVQ